MIQLGHGATAPSSHPREGKGVNLAADLFAQNVTISATWHRPMVLRRRPSGC
jgi:hypothetical protein